MNPAATLPSPQAPDGLPAASIAAVGASLDEAAALRPVVRAAIACVLGERADHPDVEDCTHEALTRAFEGRGRLRDGEPLRPWVLGIARHVALDVLRRRRRTRRAEALPPGGAGGQGEILEAVEDPAPGPEERAAQRERARRIDVALQKLAEPQRRALLAFHVEGLDYQQISRRLGVPLGTVATWIARGRRCLAEALGE
ncbi:sigma-70 family RNA polymerase sigma factor [Sorangium sp. So ce1036]|uniref:RNA polymerase sigma factor n=1 Tax=Sorangium sp. So ce1036 TaxID=3133328 RepID=UPI003EFD5816